METPALKWSTIRWLGNSRIVKTSYLWFFLVPMAAKLLGPFAGEHNIVIPLFEPPKTFSVDVQLPFSWQVLFVASTFFMLGQLVYTFCCPEIVQQYKSYGEYQQDHPEGFRPLQRWFRKLVNSMTHESADRFLTKLEKTTGATGGVTKSREALTKCQSSLTQSVRDLIFDSCRRDICDPRNPIAITLRSDRFDVVLEESQLANAIWCIASSVFFLVGLVLFVVIITQNVWAFILLVFG